MIASGTACASPVSDGVLMPNALAMSGWNSEISLCTMPMPSAASTVIPNDEKRPTSAAASAGRTASERTAAFKRDDRGEQDRGEGRQPARDREVRHLDPVRRPSRTRRDPAVLGDCGSRETEQRARVDKVQHDRAHERDPDEHEPVTPDDEVAEEGHVPRRQQRAWLGDIDTPSQHHERLEDTEETEGGDEPREAGRVAEQRHHQVREQTEPDADEEPERDGQRRRACPRPACRNRRRRRCHRARRH